MSNQEFNHKVRTDWARLNLDSAKAHAQIEMDFMRAKSDYAMKMMQVFELQRQISRTDDKHRMLVESYKRYVSELKQLKRNQKKVQRRLDMIRKMTGYCRLLWEGESIDYRLVGRAWTGYRWLFRNLEGSRVEISVPLAKQDLYPDNFYCPKNPEKKANVPNHIKSIHALAMWCRRTSMIPGSHVSFVPVTGSSFQQKLMAMIEFIDGVYLKKAEVLEIDVAEQIQANVALAQKHFSDVKAAQ